MRPAVLYAAKSSADEKGSIPNQLREGRELAEGDGRTVVEKFEDEKKSAYTQDRGDGLVAARAECERLVAEHGECALVIQHSDRLARGDGRQAAHLVEYALWAIKSGVKIMSIQDPETFAQDDLIYAVLTGHRNHEDSRRKSQATKAGLRERREEGKFGGGPTPFGYAFDKQADMLVEDPVESVTVRRVFEEFVGGESLTGIARNLQADGVSTRRGRFWRSSTISQIVSNPAYIGKLRHGEGMVDGIHEGLVDRERWDQAQVLLASRRRKGKGRRPKAKHLLQGGKLKSPCGGTMVCRSEYEGHYICERRQHNLGECACPILPRSVVDSAIYAYFVQVGLDVEATRAQLADARNRKLAELKTLTRQAESERQQAEERLRRVRRDYADGKITAEDWSDFRGELTAELDAAKAQGKRLAERGQETEDWVDLQDAERDTLAMLSDIRESIADTNDQGEGVDAVRAALMRLFDHFVVRQVQPGDRVHADLAWQGEGVIIEPVVREQAVEGYTSLRPIFRREPLYDAENKQGMAHASRLRRKLDPEHGRFISNCWGIGYRLIDG
jgi:DNA invertase Pin-like site-specific DNA recombinase